ncbi:hypothetical protein ILUMI_03968 [Ignelater luminosus]|uniref:CLIP domain-containing serine protease n=1 Tax=Ignelater luminosus TaxID=2038154 RepID=A0A8K0GLN0_IGNLU|nr:hypothetical protein ILUMI_03968 [Ignelater luminosus]
MSLLNFGTSLCVFLVISAISVNAQLNSNCITPNKENATCMPITHCEVIFSAVNTKNAAAVAFARDSYCGKVGRVILVCCGSTAYPEPSSTDDIFDLFSDLDINISTTEKSTPKPQPKPLEDFETSVLPDRTVCGLESDSERIFGGEQTKLDEFPWMVALEFNKKGTHKSEGDILCGGSLINTRYVLTAAHCLEPSGLKLVNVRLGEWNTKSDSDCEELFDQIECADKVVRINIEETIAHPYFSRRTYNNDIGLIKLERDVAYTDYIRPICLPRRNLPVAPIGTLMTVTGWGTTENGTLSNVKLKVRLPLVSNEICQQKLLRGKDVGANQLCVGGDPGKDACQGDSGGPLMRIFEDVTTAQSQWYLEGVVSKGQGCGRAGLPAVYTRVSRYISWIISIISEEYDLE